MTNKNEQAPKGSDNGPDMAGHDKATSGDKSNVAQMEEKVLSFWQDNKLFEQSLSKPSPKGEYVFYDGPPFATGEPHYGHLLAGTIKDAIPRYQTMRGYHVVRRWGWDCHGLPIENLIQKENGLKSKQDIEDFGIKEFNEKARESVFRYDAEWRKVVPRTGRWVDMDDRYTTMDSTFTESVLWGFKQLYDKGLVYEGFKSMHISPLLETPLSNMEVGQAYKDIVDISVFVKFPLVKEKDTYFIAWTTTPWTLPGNTALAVGKDIEYVKVEHNFNGEKKEKYYVAKELVDTVFEGKEYSVLEEVKGEDLLGKEYIPVFDSYSNDKGLENRDNGWKVYHGDFVTTEDGSGIVHIAPAFGEDDLLLSQEENIPFVQHVKINGEIKGEVKELAGRQAKPKATDEEPNKHQETDIEVIKYLAHNGFLFEKKKYTHSYPHCWRTDAPLLNYAMSSWFIKVTDYRDKMIKLNKKVDWVPSAVGEKRFGNWLENIKDWGVSRSRFWGTPMPIWRSEDGDVKVLGSLEEIREKTKGSNEYYLMRHGESDHNVKKFLSADNSEKALSNLTEKGRRDVEKAASELKSSGIDLVFYSPLKRTKDTAFILKEVLGLSDEQLIEDERLKEVQSGVFNGKSESEYHAHVDSTDRFVEKPEGGENLSDIRRRVGDFIYEIDGKHEGKKILVISHDYPIWLLKALSKGLENDEVLEAYSDMTTLPGEYSKLDFAPIPHNDDYILDYHRPYIDDVVFEEDGKKYTRVEDVFDTWFDSGSMPFAINHYPFNQETFDPGDGFFGKEKGFPADFIAEGLDQTRGWFYSLLAVNTGLFKKAPYKNVIVNGLVLAEDGRKMSKRLKNYPDPNYVFDTYGADAMRYYMLASPIVRSEPLSFTEKGVDEVVKKITNRLLNVVTFYELYATQEPLSGNVKPGSDNPLDIWILNRLAETVNGVTKGMENHELDRAARPILDFIDDLSTWYLRRSRDRFKEGSEADRNMATKTLGYVILHTSKVLAPFMPFLAEEVYQRVTKYEFNNSEKSVHLSNWPEEMEVDSKSLKDMEEVRDLVTEALLARDKVGIKVRQPLQSLTIPNSKLDQSLLEIIKDEVNVKEVLVGDSVSVDTNITDELKKEGVSRELIRFIQSLRKKAGLNPDDVIGLTINVDEEGKKVIDKYINELKKTANIADIKYVDSSERLETLETEGYKFSVKI